MPIIVSSLATFISKTLSDGPDRTVVKKENVPVPVPPDDDAIHLLPEYCAPQGAHAVIYAHGPVVEPILQLQSRVPAVRLPPAPEFTASQVNGAEEGEEDCVAETEMREVDEKRVCVDEEEPVKVIGEVTELLTDGVYDFVVE